MELSVTILLIFRAGVRQVRSDHSTSCLTEQERFSMWIGEKHYCNDNNLKLNQNCAVLKYPVKIQLYVLRE